MIDFLERLVELRLNYLDRKRELQRIDKICTSCEVLQLELSKAHDINKNLMEKLLHKPEENKIDTSELKPILPTRHMNFNVRRQMLEAESRKAASILQQKNEENSKTVTDLTNDLEKELRIAEDIRAEKSGRRKE